MFDLPDFEKAFDFENGYYLTSKPQRFGKALAQFELFKRCLEVPGSIVECGVFKGASFIRFATVRHLYELEQEKALVGFDVFGAFPKAQFEDDMERHAKFTREAGDTSISEEQLRLVLARKGLDANVDLVKGLVEDTVPRYVADHPDLEIALLHIDTDLYEPCAVILEHLYPKVARGGVVIVDNYNVFPGETKAVDEYFDGAVAMETTRFSKTPSYFIKP